MNAPPEQSDRDDCVACRRSLLRNGPGPHAVSAQTAAAQAHLQDCAACRAYADEMLAWRRLGGRLREHVTAPSVVRQRLFRELALARTQWLTGRTTKRRRWPWAGGLAAVAMIVALAVVALVQRPPAHPSVDAAAASAVAQDHWRDLHRQHIDSSSPATVQRWLAARLPIPVQVMALQGAALQGARLCFLRGRLGAVLRYRVGKASVSYYVMPGDTHAEAVNRDRTAIKQESEQGYNVVLWQDRGLLHALVSDLPRKRLHQLAATCHPAKLAPAA